MTRGRHPQCPAAGHEGAVVTWLPLLLWLVGLLAVVIVDLGGHLVAGARAASLADAAALAAVSADASSRPETPRAAAARVAAAGDGRLERCACADSARATVTVSVAIDGLVWPRLGPSRRTAAAEAVLVPTTGSAAPRAGHPPGPS